MTPSSLNSSGLTKATNFKKAKERVTILGCCNASGSCKLPLVLINKSSKPRCFKHMNMRNLPVRYYSQRKSWMDCRIFSEWFHQEFVPAVQTFCTAQGFEKKAILLLDNAPSHPSTESLQSSDGKIKTMFLPPNTTAAIQPMDQGVLDPCKRRYKKKLLHHIILENESEAKTVPEILKEINMKDVVFWIASAWEEASADSLRKSWNKLLPPESDLDSDDGTEDTTEVSEVAAQLGPDIENDICDWMEADIGDPGHQHFDDDEIIADITSGGNDESQQSSDEEGPTENTVSAGEAFDALGVTLRWLEQTNADPNHLLLVKKWQDEASMIRSQSLKQTKLSSYFGIQHN